MVEESDLSLPLEGKVDFCVAKRRKRCQRSEKTLHPSAVRLTPSPIGEGFCATFYLYCLIFSAYHLDRYMRLCYNACIPSLIWIKYEHLRKEEIPK